MNKQTIAVLGLLAVFAPGLAAAGNVGWEGPAIVATQQDHHRSSPQEVMRSKVYMSRDGARYESNDPAGQMIAVVNAKLAKCWYVHAAKGIYMESAMNRTTGDCHSFMGPVGEADAVGGMLSAAPCEDYANKQRRGQETVAGRTTVKWSCTDTRKGLSATHWWDPKLRAVIKEETSDGNVSELSDIRETSFPADLLELPKGYKRVSAEQFQQAVMSGVPLPGAAQ